jgi:hypothetical protein
MYILLWGSEWREVNVMVDFSVRKIKLKLFKTFQIVHLYVHCRKQFLTTFLS